MGTRMTRADRQDQLIKSFVRPRYRISRAMGAAKIQVNGQPENADKISIGRLHKGPIKDNFM